MTFQRRDEWIYQTLCRLIDPLKSAQACSFTRPSAAILRRMLAIARIHNVLGLVLEKLQEYSVIYPDVWDVAQRAWHAQVVQSLRVRRHIELIGRSFSTAGIPVSIIKGTDFADNLYPNSRLRCTFDVDVFVAREQWDDAIRVLEDNGHVEKQHQAPMNYPAGILGERTWLYLGAAETEVDLHWNLVDLPSLRKNASVEFENLDWLPAAHPNDTRRYPTPGSRVVIACMHAIYHHQFERLLLLTDLQQACRQIKTADQVRALHAIATRTKTRIAIDISLAVAAKFLEDPALEQLRLSLAAPEGGAAELPAIPDALFGDAKAALFTIRGSVKSPCRLNIRQWLRDVT